MNADNDPMNPPKFINTKNPAKNNPNKKIISIPAPEVKAINGRDITSKKANMYVPAVLINGLLISKSNIDVVKRFPST